MPVGDCLTLDESARPRGRTVSRMPYEPQEAVVPTVGAYDEQPRAVPTLAWAPHMGPIAQSPCCPGKMHRVSRSALNTLIKCDLGDGTALPERCCGYFKLVEQRLSPPKRAERAGPGKQKCFNRRTKCKHGKLISSCARCNPNFKLAPSRKCPCGKDRRFCAAHGGQNLCKCGKTKQSCMTCKDPRWICCHDGKYKEKRNCLVCGGTGACKHGTRKDRCTAAECVARQKRLRAHLASMRPGSTLSDPGVSRAQFVAGLREQVDRGAEK